MNLRQHIDDVTKRCADEIERIGLAEAQVKIGVNQGYICRFKRGKIHVTAKKLIDFATALGIQT